MKRANAFFYYNRSNLIQKTDARGVKAKYIFQFWGGGDDPLNRLQRIEYDTSGPRDMSIPINAAPASNFIYMTTGDKMRVAEIDSEYMVNQAYQYDVEGRVSRYTQKIKWRESYPMEVDYLYDTLDRVKEVKYPAQYGITGSPRKIVAHTYDTASRLSTLTYNGTQQAGNIVYNEADQTTQIKIGAAGANQVTEDYTFDAQTGLLTRQTAKKNTTTTMLDLSYNYARNNSVGSLNGKTGHLTKITDNLNTQKNREYEFDVLGRLTKAKGGPTGTLWTQTYTYDRWGNRTNVAKTGTAAGGGTMPLDGIPGLAYDNTSNRITTNGYQYDVNGNMIRSLAEDGVTWVKYEYDAANRLNIIKKDDANQTQLERFQYDHTNARVQSHDPALDRYKTYVNAGGTTLAEFTEFTVAVPQWTKSYTYFGSSQLSTITPNGQNEYIEFNHPDRLGTKVITNQAAGTSSEQAHLPFGRPLDAESTMTGSNKRFTSYDRSSKTSLDYAVNRTYDSKLGRFTQVDPIGMQAVSLGAPQTLNLYAYCVNDPVNYADPTGLFLGSFFRWLGRVLLGLSRSRVARRIAIRFVISYALSGGNFGVAIRSVLPDILQATGIFPDPRTTVPWLQGRRLPISLGTSSLSKYIIYNFLSAARARLGSCDHWLQANYDRLKPFFDKIWDKSQNSKTEQAPDGLEAGGIIYISASNVTSQGVEEIGWDIYDGPVDPRGRGMNDEFDKWQLEKKRTLGVSRPGDWSFLVVHTHPGSTAGPSGSGDLSHAIYSPEATMSEKLIIVFKAYYRYDRDRRKNVIAGQNICTVNR